MPIYKLNGGTYSIPDNVVSDFEKDNPDARIAYSDGNDRYEIPVKERDGFLKAFPNATLTSIDGDNKPDGTSVSNGQDSGDFTMKESELEGDGAAIGGLAKYVGVQKANIPAGEATSTAANTALDDERQEQQRIAMRNTEIASVRADIDKIDRQLEELGWGTLKGVYNEAPLSKDEYDEQRNRSQRINQLLAAKRQAEKRIDILQESRDKNTSGFWRNLWGVISNPLTHTFGLVDVMDRFTVEGVNNKIEEGSPLSEEEETLLQQMVRRDDAESRYGGDKGAMARWGTLAGEALPFAAEFLLTGGFGGVSGKVGGAATKQLAKFFGTNLEKKGARSWLVKATGTATGDVAAAGLMANTTGAAKTAADAMERHRGQIVQDENGNYHFGHYEDDWDGNVHFVDGGKTWAHSIYEAEVANTLEYYTEMLGSHTEKPLAWIGSKLAEKTGAKKAGAYIVKKLGLGEVSKDLSKVSANGYGRAVKNVLERGGIQDYPSEVIEEEANIILNSMLVGDNSLGDLVDGRTQADIWGGMLFSVGFMQSPAVVAGGVQSAGYLATRHKLDNADKLAAFRLTDERWTPIRELIEATSNEAMTDLETGILYDNELQWEEKQAVMDYIGRLLKFRGWNVGASARAKDDAGNPAGEAAGTTAIEGSTNISYMGGYYAGEGQHNDLKNGLEFERKRMSEFLPDETVRLLDSDPVGALPTIMNDAGLADAQKQAALDYVNAKAAYDGMIARVRDDIDSRIAISDATIERRVHREDGMIHPATLTTDRKVYVVGGNVVMSDDGTVVDREATRAANGGDGMILSVDAESGKVEAVSVEDFLSVDAPIDAEEEKRMARETVTQSYAQQEADKIDGILPFNAGDTYNVLDGEGQQHTVTIGISTGLPDGQVMASLDHAEAQPMSIEEIQQMADNANLARLAEHEAQRQAERQKGVALTTRQTGHGLNGQDGRIGRSLSEEEADDLMLETIENAERIEIKELTPENWQAEFPDGRVITPLGEVKMGEHQYEKLQERGRAGEFGMIKPTLSRPDFVIEQSSKAIGGQDAERNTSLLFVKSFIDEEGKKRYFFKSVTVQKDGLEVSISNYIDRPARVREALKKGKLLWMRTELASDSSDVNQGLYNQPGNVSEPAVEGRVNPQRTSNSGAKVTENFADVQGKGQEKVAPMPMKDGEPDFMAATPKRTHQFLYGESEMSAEDADQFVAANKKAADNALKKAKEDAKKEPKDISFSKFLAEKKAKQAKVDAAQAQADYWKAVQEIQRKRAFAEQTEDAGGRANELEAQKDTQARIDAAKKMYGDYFNADMSAPQDINELIAMNLPKNISWEGREGVRGLQRELGALKRGFGRKGDTQAFNSYLAKRGEGISIDEAVHQIWESADNQLSNGEQLYDTEQIRGALHDMFMQADKPGFFENYVLNNRIAAAEEMRAAEDAATANAQAIEQEDAEIMRLTGLTRDEYDAWITGLEGQIAAQAGYENSEQRWHKWRRRCWRSARANGSRDWNCGR